MEIEYPSIEVGILQSVGLLLDFPFSFVARFVNPGIRRRGQIFAQHLRALFCPRSRLLLFIPDNMS